ncbi:MAG: aldo/keto reductase [Lachnospiraceae bacterium]|nr:aldo/keto reductase [Lachnospiraceae bacterium]
MIYVKLNNGVEVPMLGLGVFRTPEGEETINAVKWAMEAGYRHVDTAKMYHNEASVSAGIKAAGLKREDVFITSKIIPEDIILGKTAEGFDQTLAELGSDYVDLMLLHFPMKDEMNIAAYKTLEEYYKAGKARAIGVSNYNNRQLGVILDNCEIAPAVNQIHITPFANEQERLDFCMSKGIYTEAASPFGGTGRTDAVLKNPTICAIAEEVGKSPAQVVIRWNLQRGTIMIPKSVHQERIISNFDVFDFELNDEQISKILALNDPDNYPFMDAESAYDRWSARLRGEETFPPRR